MARVRLYRTNRVKMAFSEPAACRRDCPQGESKRGYRGILIGVQGNLRVSTRESATPYREISFFFFNHGIHGMSRKCGRIDLAV